MERTNYVDSNYSVFLSFNGKVKDGIQKFASELHPENSPAVSLPLSMKTPSFRRFLPVSKRKSWPFCNDLYTGDRSPRPFYC